MQELWCLVRSVPAKTNFVPVLVTLTRQEKIKTSGYGAAFSCLVLFYGALLFFCANGLAAIMPLDRE